MYERILDNENMEIRHGVLGFYPQLSKDLCMKLNKRFNDLEVDDEQIQKLLVYLNLLAVKDLQMAEHSIRVALLGEKIAQKINCDSKALLFSGLLHDVGKVLVPASTLKKESGFNKHDMNLIKQHPLNTFRLLDGVFDFSAQIGVRHHSHQNNKYPEYLPASKAPLSDKTLALADYYSRILAVADFFDALVSRTNDKYEKCENMSLENAIDITLENNSDQKELISYLNELGIFEEHLKLIK